MAMADMLIYLGSSNSEFSGMRGRVPGVSSGIGLANPFSWDDYADLVYTLRPDYMKHEIFSWGLPSTGLLPGDFSYLMNGYSVGHGGASFGEAVWQTKNPGLAGGMPPSMTHTIWTQLGANLPVPWLHLLTTKVPYLEETQSRVVGIGMYEDRNRSGFAAIGDYPSFLYRQTNSGVTARPGDDYYSLTLANAVSKSYHDHYVVITELIDDGFDGKEKVVVASWGGRLVMETSNMYTGDLGGLYRFAPEIDRA
jgi:hypothetical protein